MIMDGLVLVWSQLNQYIKQRTNTNDGDCVFLSSLVDAGGSAVSPADAVTMTLMHAEEEGVNRAQRFKRVEHEESYTYYEPEIRMNLFVLVSVRPSKNSDGSKHYVNALTRLSMVSEFFQSHRYFDQRTLQVSGVSQELDRVIVDLHTMGFEQLSYVWGMHGGQYLPSLMYKLSLIKIQAEVPTREVPVVRALDVEGDGGGL